ncbi:hypothetical protein MITS9509_01570 [Synechococcus sp. MIT S9509]|uniref:hypothetical protein n=1 Tax=unclassified Synechococcus TaxID=2626047 RepID=UPI0007BC7655|nr:MULTISPECIES: hypothetical protein [unclassified Synechococcus]KZR88103.1 hypothetical protein MITS9504_00530 [Synechococcus sp. MIT S9504]KZR92112.1 hypothetical protein MITS9509_01570 [Synechococcus sp. MIT S9509]
MPHFVTFDVVPRPEKDSFGSFEPRHAKLQEASTNDDLTGRKGLNWSEICDVGTSLRQADELTGSFDTREVKPVEIGQPPELAIGGLKGGQEGEELFPTDSDLNDVVIGVKEKVGGTFAFETGVPVEGLHDSVYCVTAGCGQNTPISTVQPVEEPPGIVIDTEAPSMSMHQGAMNSVWGQDLAGNLRDLAGNVRDAAGNTSKRYRLGPGATFEDITETFKPVPGMHSFAGSLSPVPGDSDTAGPLCKSYLEPQFGWGEICDVGLS